ncbi:MAG: mannosyl-3-phosphoglycerate phosphatase [Patiriisocius sp.]|jgi:mannosyl-3-phosphoglycerate phosphatase
MVTKNLRWWQKKDQRMPLLSFTSKVLRYSDKMSRLVISTDMDGTLLGHHSYDYAVAQPLLAALTAKKIPVILNTSKTAAEIQFWQSELGLDLPAVIENGSAWINPGAKLHVHGATMHDLDAFLRAYPPHATNFLTCEESIAHALTGLEGAALQAARLRQFTVPLDFAVPTDAEHYQTLARAQGLQCVRGGRFYSLQGQCSKGTTLKHVIAHFEQTWQDQVQLIALGDNLNDLDMLMAADVAVVVKSSDGQYQVRPEKSDTIYTDAIAPVGWVEGITKAMQKLSIRL